jgi:hypothetical protein
MPRFQPGIAAMYAWTAASPSAFAICGLPSERRTTFLPFRDKLASFFLDFDQSVSIGKDSVFAHSPIEPS